MHRIDTATATPDHKFTEGDPAVPVAATTVSAEWLNAVQEELVAVITGAGLELKKSDNGQLWQAISQLITNAKPGLATKAKPGLVQVGGGLNITPEGLLSVLAASVTQAGIVQLASGLSDSTTTAPTCKAVKDAIESKLAAVNVPVGGILPFSGTFGGEGNRFPIPLGEDAPDMHWCLCDGTTTNGLPVPDLAKSVDYDPKTLTYTFHLRDGVKWHDGAPFSARDVVYTYTALTSDKTLTSTITSNYQDISRISAPDERTVVIRLARVNAAMLDNFCMGILPAHLYEGHDINTVPANHAPVGTGRFKFVSWDTAGGMIVLERNTDYYGKVPSIERIVYKTVAVESTKALMLRSGEADLAWLNAKYARTFRGKDGFTTVDFTTADLRTVAMDFHTPFWQRNKDSIAVLNYAVDKQAIVDGVLAGQGFPAFSPIQTSPLGGNPAADVYPYDLKKFAAEMERLGWKKGPDGIYARNGERFSFTIQVRDYEEERVDIINVLSRQFKKAGVEMNIALVTRFDWKAGYNGYLAGFAAEFDPDGVFKSFVTGASDNNMAYSSPKVDELLREGRATEDPAKRKAAYQAFEVAYAAMPAQLPLVYLHGNYVSVAGLKGLDTTRVLGHHAVGVMWNIEDWTLQR